ncbi:hypothetical protein KIMH_14430 [Bombiscardovia apis]|uniref:Uncharacterized protein n=1 Tax=Bombiscardovia apis TaxID=2932182 RepID=A0ABN6SH38_9BIFI|nr:hypothetical protein [Bombiscardovia apis]BDR55332.1 hypothetical protein KIMH_14430 [Bombiscardovia apis]
MNEPKNEIAGACDATVEEPRARFAELDFEQHGFDEKELAAVLAKEESSLLAKLVEGRQYNSRLREKEGAHDFNQADIAGRMGAVSQAYVSQLENGLVSLVGKVTRYARAAGLVVHYEVSSALDGQSIPAHSAQYNVEPSPTATVPAVGSKKL